MKIAILGTLSPTITYYYWERIFRRYFWKTKVTEINITDGETLLNSYVRSYADNLSIPVSVYKINGAHDDAVAKKKRNIALVDDADLVVAFTNNDTAEISNNETVSKLRSQGKPVFILNTDKLKISQSRIVIRDTKNDYREVSREELITVEEELALVKQIRLSPEDCEAAKEKLIFVNRRFVRMVAEQYASERYSVEELMLEGNKGLLRAVDKFDETKGFKFISYAIWWVKEYIRQYINN